jgi:predicted N-acetyltransferase YhbS
MIRAYERATDFGRVGRFLVRTYRSKGTHINWLQPQWEYMHFHPLVDDVDLSRIGVWESAGEIVGVVHPEHASGRVYLQVDPACDAVREKMLIYAEEYLSVQRDGVRRLGVHINDADNWCQHMAAARGFARTTECESMARFEIPGRCPEIALPPGFRLQSLAEENDLHKLDRLLWRGFGHGDEPEDDGIEGRAFMQSAPNYRLDLNIVVVAPEGHFVSYCGMWYESVQAVAYVEPVATDLDFRGMGLGRAAVLEGIRRCARLGATVAWVGSGQRFYQSFGFRVAYQTSVWQRESLIA